MKRIKKSRVLPSGGAITLAFFLLLAGCNSQKNAVAVKAVLKVNGTEISTQEFAERLAQRLRDFDALTAKDERNLNRAKEDLVETYVLEIIVRDYAKSKDITVSKEELEQEMARTRAWYPDDLAFRRSLAEGNVSFDRWKDDLRQSLLQKKVLRSVTSSAVEPTEKEMKEYYDKNVAQFQRPDRVQLRQIVLEKEDNATRIAEELAKGANFESLAKQFSIAPESAEGGLTGWIEKGTLEVFDTAFKMNVGARSKVLSSPYGYHIFEVIKKEHERRLSFEESKDRIRPLMMESREQAAFSAWLEQQVRRSTVLRNDVLINAIKVTTRGN